MDPLVITVALVGAEVTREEQPNLPVTPEEIGRAAQECRDAGASVVHLHVRNPDGTPTQDAATFRAAIAEIRAHTDLIVQVSTGGAVGMSAEERAQSLETAADMATLTCGTVNFGEDVFMNPPGLIRELARRMKDRRITPEVEVFDFGMIATAERLQAEELVPVPAHFDLVLGVPGGADASAATLVDMVRRLPPGSSYSVAAVGRHQLLLNTMAIAMGGHVRTGFEDNIYFAKGRKATSNAELVARVVRIAGELQRPIATPQEARRLLRIGQA
jgi:3-keto-5-aminohexanoate cleavage enzyme